MVNLASALLLVSLASPRPVVVVVGPATGPGARARAQIQAALSHEEGLAVESLGNWLSAARAAGIQGRAARSRAAVPRVAKAAGVDAAVVLTVRGEEPRPVLRAVLVDAQGSARWASTYPLGSQGITPKRRFAIAGAVAAALRPAQLGIDLTPPPRSPPIARTAPRPTPTPAKPGGRVTVPARHEEPAEELPQDPVLRVEIGMPVSWRRASLSPASGPGFEYRSSDPYFGVALDVRLAPLRIGQAPAGPAWLQPLEVDLALAHSFASTRLSDGRTIGSGEQRAGLDLVYPWTLPTATRVAVRAGFALHRFAIDPNDVSPTSMRTGVRLGLDLRQPFLRRWAVDAGIRAYPISGPGSDELARSARVGAGFTSCSRAWRDRSLSGAA
jgi:hypothetical protein